jgi:hypothetical protein
MSRAREIADLGSPAASGLSNRNLIINSAMAVAQRSASVTGIGATSGYFTLDRFKTTFGATSAGRLTMSQSTVADLEGFSNALKVDCTTADTSIAAGELFVIQHILEGFNLQRLKASSTTTKSFTFSFYAKSNASRAIASEFEFTNGTNKQISKLHTIGTSWARYTMTVPAASSTQIDDDNSAELTINFWLHAGSTYTSGTINDDALAPTTSANRAAGIGSLFASTNNTLEITGIQLEVGEIATPFEHEDFGTTLSKCQRYYAKSWSQGSAVTTNAGVIGAACVGNANRAFGNVFWPVTMRSAPTVTWYSGSTGTANKWRNASQGTDITAASPIAAIGQSGYGFVLSSGIVGITDTLQGHYQAEAEL